MSEMPELVEGKEPAWLVALADQRLAFIKEHGAKELTGMGVIVTPISAPADDSPKAVFAWEHSCDNCKEPFSLTEPHVGGSVRRDLDDKTPVFFTFGACKRCLHLDQ